MDKKKIALSVGIILFMIIVIVIYNIVLRKRNNNNNVNNVIDQNIVSKPENKDVINIGTGTVTCESKTQRYHKMVFKAKSDKLTAVQLFFSRPGSNFGIESQDTLTNEEKNAVGAAILKELNLDSFNYKGVNMAYSYKNGVVLLKINIDYTDVDLNILEKLGVNFEGKFSTIMKIILSSKEYTCKVN